MDFLKSTVLSMQETLHKKLEYLASNIDKLELNQHQHSIATKDQNVQDSSSSKILQVIDAPLKGIKLEILKFAGENVFGLDFQG